jgi:hypothetical protein
MYFSSQEDKDRKSSDKQPLQPEDED